MALTEEERGRLYAAIGANQHNFIEGPGKRIAQMAMEECLFMQRELAEAQVAAVAARRERDVFVRASMRNYGKFVTMREAWRRQRASLWRSIVASIKNKWRNAL